MRLIRNIGLRWTALEYVEIGPCEGDIRENRALFLALRNRRGSRRERRIEARAAGIGIRLARSSASVTSRKNIAILGYAPPPKSQRSALPPVGEVGEVGGFSLQLF
jgi:hypothetical protein